MGKTHVLGAYNILIEPHVNKLEGDIRAFRDEKYFFLIVSDAENDKHNGRSVEYMLLRDGNAVGFPKKQTRV